MTTETFVDESSDTHFFMLHDGEEISQVMISRLEKNGYSYNCAKAADGSGRRLVYFTRVAPECTPAPGM